MPHSVQVQPPLPPCFTCAEAGSLWQKLNEAGNRTIATWLYREQGTIGMAAALLSITDLCSCLHHPYGN